jgi:hypothetical protein
VTPTSNPCKPIRRKHVFHANHREVCLVVRFDEQKRRPQRHAGIVGRCCGVMTCCERLLLRNDSHRRVAGPTQLLRKAESIPRWPLADKFLTDRRGIGVRRRSAMGANAPTKTDFDACRWVSTMPNPRPNPDNVTFSTQPVWSVTEGDALSLSVRAGTWRDRCIRLPLRFPTSGGTSPASLKSHHRHSSFI